MHLLSYLGFDFSGDCKIWLLDIVYLIIKCIMRNHWSFYLTLHHFLPSDNFAALISLSCFLTCLCNHPEPISSHPFSSTREKVPGIIWGWPPHLLDSLLFPQRLYSDSYVQKLVLKACSCFRFCDGGRFLTFPSLCTHSTGIYEKYWLIIFSWV